jgi:hypothetical protein
MDSVPRPFEMPQWPDWLRGWPQSFESEASGLMERMVAGEGFAELLVHMTENAVALSRISADFWDAAVRNLRLAGRADIDRLAGQLANTEEKLERLLQVLEQLAEPAVEQSVEPPVEPPVEQSVEPPAAQSVEPPAAQSVEPPVQPAVVPIRDERLSQ